MKTSRHLAMAVDLASAGTDGFLWEMAQMSGTLAISFYVQSTEELLVMWEQLPPEKRTTRRHDA